MSQDKKQQQELEAFFKDKNLVYSLVLTLLVLIPLILWLEPYRLNQKIDHWSNSNSLVYIGYAMGSFFFFQMMFRHLTRVLVRFFTWLGVGRLHHWIGEERLKRYEKLIRNVLLILFFSMIGLIYFILAVAAIGIFYFS